MQAFKGSEFFLDGYITDGAPKEIIINGSKYKIQCFQGDHEDEYVLKKDRKVCLFQNGVLKMIYEEDVDGAQVGEFTRFENGRVAFVQSFDDLLDNLNFNRIVNHENGERMEIYSNDSGKLIYHGEFNEKREREGRGIQYDEKTGRMLLEGIWKGNKLVEIIRKIEGNIMTEFKQNGNNIIASNRIPIYVGEFVYDESKESFIRNGRGYWIDEKTRIATREVELKDGVEVSGRDLYDGWYTQSTKQESKPKPKYVPVAAPKLAKPVPKRKEPAPNKIKICKSVEMGNVSLDVTDLTVLSNGCNGLNELDLSRFKLLQSIEIGDECFGSVKTFKIEGLNRLKTIKIGNNSFTQTKNNAANDPSKSFHILNCESLESIEIGEYSFSDFAGEFELKNLPQLQSIQLGIVESYSFNFHFSTFMIRGIDDIEFCND